MTKSSAAVRHGQPPAVQRAAQKAPPQEPEEDFKAMQQRRLEDINFQLTEIYHTDPLCRLGNYQNGEQELVRIESVLDNRWFALVQFETREAHTGDRGIRYIRFPKRYKIVKKGEKKGPQLPLVTTVVVNGQALFVREFAAAQLTGKRPWRVHSPRQYAMSGSEDSFLKRVLAQREDTGGLREVEGAHTLFGRKLSRLLSKPGVKLVRWQIMHEPDETGNPASIAEDDTFCAGGVIHLLLVFDAPPAVEAIFRDRKLQLADEPDGEQDPAQLQLLSLPEAIARAQDQHTLTGFLLLARLANAIDTDKIAAFIRTSEAT